MSGQSSPGVSERTMPLRRSICCAQVVMAGLSPTLALHFPTRVLIRVDLPTFGMPTTMTRSDLPGLPRLGARLWQSLINWFTSRNCFADSGRARTPSCFSKVRTHALVTAGSARSFLFITLIQGLLRRSSSSSLLELEAGSRASSTSMTTSTFRINSEIFFVALPMCPGYHSIVMCFLPLTSLVSVHCPNQDHAVPSAAVCWLRSRSAACPVTKYRSRLRLPSEPLRPMPLPRKRNPWVCRCAHQLQGQLTPLRRFRQRDL